VDPGALEEAGGDGLGWGWNWFGPCQYVYDGAGN